MKKPIFIFLLLLMGVTQGFSQNYIPYSEFENDTVKYLSVNFSDGDPYKDKKFSVFLKNHELRADSVILREWKGVFSAIEIYYYPLNQRFRRSFLYYLVVNFKKSEKSYDQIKEEVKDLPVDQQLEYFKDFEISSMGLGTEVYTD
ncbi:MAG: hypothetical protein LIO79_05090 [Rikenellaceae bacterium]|nr:hypothetical protein [Rikenellaceae bacterium]